MKAIILSALFFSTIHYRDRDRDRQTNRILETDSRIPHGVGLNHDAADILKKTLNERISQRHVVINH